MYKFLFALLIVLTSFGNLNSDDKHIFDVLSMTNEDLRIHSNMTLKQAIRGTKAPQEIIDSLVLVDVQYYTFNGELHQGQIVINRELKQDIIEIFDIIKSTKFPVNLCKPIVEYKWDDNLSMAANNSSGFNYRFVANTDRLSQHALGRAFDINPMQNPVIYGDGRISPPGAVYDTTAKGTLTAQHPITKAFTERGWTWGGEWNSLKDYHHFEKKY